MFILMRGMWRSKGAIFTLQTRYNIKIHSNNMNGISALSSRPKVCGTCLHARSNLDSTSLAFLSSTCACPKPCRYRRPGVSAGVLVGVSSIPVSSVYRVMLGQLTSFQVKCQQALVIMLTSILRSPSLVCGSPEFPCLYSVSSHSHSTFMTCRRPS